MAVTLRRGPVNASSQGSATAQGRVRSQFDLAVRTRSTTGVAGSRIIWVLRTGARLIRKPGHVAGRNREADVFAGLRIRV